MKLLYITNGICGAGGLERVLSLKASYLSDVYKYEIHILSLNEEGLTPFYEFSSNVTFWSLNLKNQSPFHYLYYYTKDIRQIVKKINPDIISVCDDGLKGFLLPILLNKPCPMIYERHVSRLISGNSSKATIIYFVMKQLARMFNRFIVLTEQNRKEWPSLKNIQVISNPLSFYPKTISSCTSKAIVAVGKFCHQKGYDLLVEAWANLVNTNRDWHLHIYGSKKEMFQQVHESIIEFNLKNIHLHDPVKNIQDKYLESSIYVMSSRFEGFGMVLIEAMSCGLPCVSFDCPYGPGDIITNEEDGFLVENGNIEELTLKLQLLMSDYELRIKMGDKARENVKCFRIEKIAEEWDTLFQQLNS